MVYDIKHEIEDVYEEDRTFTGNVTVDGTFTVKGTFTFGDAAVDTLILKGRMSTMTAGGSAVDINATYINTYQELWEIRGTVSAWGTKDSFKLAYFNATATLGGSVGLRCAEFYARMDTSTTTGLSSLQNIYAEMLVKASASNRTLTNAHCIEANVSIENQTGTLTLTNNIYGLYAKIQSGTGINNYTKLNGIRISGRDDGTTRVFGNALHITDAEGTVCTWTTGINISTTCATGLSIASSTKGMSVISTLTGTSNLDANTVTVTDNTTAGAYCRGFAIGVTAAGAKTGSGEVDGIGVDMTCSGNTTYLYGISLYGASVSNPTIGFASNLSIYQDNMGSALGHYCAIDVGIALSDAPSGRYTYFRLRDHSSAIPISVFKFEGAHCATNFFSYLATDGTPDFIIAAAVSSTQDKKIKVDCNGTSYYIPLYVA